MWQRFYDNKRTFNCKWPSNQSFENPIFIGDLFQKKSFLRQFSSLSKNFLKADRIIQDKDMLLNNKKTQPESCSKTYSPPFILNKLVCYEPHTFWLWCQWVEINFPKFKVAEQINCLVGKITADVVVINAPQLHSNDPERRICTG